MKRINVVEGSDDDNSSCASLDGPGQQQVKTRHGAGTTRGSPRGEAAVPAPAVENPTVKDPTVEDPIAEGPTVEGPTVEDPTLGDPTVEDPTVAVEDPTVEDCSRDDDDGPNGIPNGIPILIPNADTVNAAAAAKVAGEEHRDNIHRMENILGYACLHCLF